MTLVVVGIVVMFTTALVATNRNLFGFTRNSVDQTQALALGRGGLNRLIDRIIAEGNYADDLDYGDTQTGYNITFNTSDPNRSVNNLMNDSVSPGTNYLDEAVPPHTADIIVVARSNGVVRRFRYILKRGLAFQGAMAANGRIIFGEDVELKSITSLHDDQPVETRFHANDYDDDGTGVDWTDRVGHSFLIGDGCEVSSVSSVVQEIADVDPDKVSQHVPAVPVPELDVENLVSGAAGSPAPTPLPDGGFFCEGSRHIVGPVTATGDIHLYNGSLYVDGDLTIAGGLVGFGSVYATGDVHITGGNASVITNQPSGAAILAGGDLTFESLGAAGYIEALAVTDPSGVGTAWTRFKDAYRVLSEVTNPSQDVSYVSPADFDLVFPDPALNPYATFLPDYLQSGPYLRADQIHWAGFHLGKGNNTIYPDQNDPTLYRHLSLPAPDGQHFSRWYENSYSRAVNDAVVIAGGSNPRVEQVSRALEQVAYYFRHNYWSGSESAVTCDCGYAQGVHGQTWDDESLRPYADEGLAYSIDRQLWLAHGRGGVPANAVHPDYGDTFTPNKMAEGMENYFRYHDPLDFSWLGTAYFQGLLYARGDITILNGAEVIGTVVAGGDLTVTDGAKFTYNKEYDELTHNLTGAVRVTSFQEL